MKDISRVNILNVGISAVNMDSAVSYLFDSLETARGSYICAANVHTTVTAYEGEEYRKVQNGSFLTLPDGKPLSVIGKRCGFKEMERVTGPDFMERILADTENSQISHYFYGNKADNLQALKDALRMKYPGIKIAGMEPSVFRDLSEIEKKNLRKRITDSKADFVWVALGAPKQDFFCAEMCEGTKAVWIGVGGAFDVISGWIPRAPMWMQKVGLEWMYRLIKEPKRLFKRYLSTNSKFIFYLLREKSKGEK